MTPAQAIAALDRQIARSGQTVKLRKAADANKPEADKTLRAFVRGYTPEELSGGIQQGQSAMVVSPTALAASGFDGPIKRLDKVTIAGRLRTIELANPVMMDDQVVRIECWVTG